MMPIYFLFELLARQLDFLGIQNDHMVATYQERSILRSVFTRQNGSCFGGDASKYLISRIDHVPFVERGQFIRC